MEKQSHLSPQGKAVLTRVAEWLEAGAPHTTAKGQVISGFDMTVGIKETGCGTACCIAGAVVQFNTPVKNIDGECNWHYVQEKARSILGITWGEAVALFEPRDESGLTKSYSPTQAAKVVRHFIETGRVAWGKVKPLKRKD